MEMEIKQDQYCLAQYTLAKSMSFWGRDKTNGRIFFDGVVTETGVFSSVWDAAQDNAAGKLICDSLVKPCADNMPAHIEFVCLNR